MVLQRNARYQTKRFCNGPTRNGITIFDLREDLTFPNAQISIAGLDFDDSLGSVGSLIAKLPDYIFRTGYRENVA